MTVHFQSFRPSHFFVICQFKNGTKFNVPYAIIMKMLSQPAYENYYGMLMMMAPADWGLFVTKSARELIWKYEVRF